MRSYLIVSMLTVVFGAFFMGIVQEYRGYLVIVLDQISIEMNIWLAILVLCSILFIVITTSLIFSDLPSVFGLRKKWADHMQNKSFKSTKIGLQSYVLGSWDDAVRQLSFQKKPVLPPEILLQYVAKAEANNGNLDRARKIIEKLKRRFPKLKSGADLLLAGLLCDERRYTEAEQVLWEAHQRDSSNWLIIETLVDISNKNQNWTRICAFLPMLKAIKSVSSGKKIYVEQIVYQAKIRTFLNASSGDDRVKRKKLFELWKSIPRTCRNSSKVLLTYTKALSSVGAGFDAKVLLEKELAKRWCPILVSEFGRIEEPTTLEHLATAELWLEKYPNDAELLLALGRISRRLNFFAKATDYLEHLISQNRSTAAIAELALVKVNLGETNYAIELYQSVLDSITHR
ncbi:MAG: hypothetical protein CBC09_05940 [Cellvibrionales bacterium TMED49]|nr:hypothetical protein [Porticoccaceae bacterium]OUU38309.1 MAG: hypothetical protein CBC09_05940 [Cellvibrionales bacterium TMED49]|tara:strand:- start:34 stop:1236 length:1203 start_codon:yes stop_codon:yes gene_type:complete